jgi:hypothetical protein
MTRSPRPYFPLLAAALLSIAATGFVYHGATKYQKDIPVTKEKELKVSINAGYGDLYISRGKSSQVLHTSIDSDLKNDLESYIDYSVRDQIGYLSINTSDDVGEGKKGSFHISGFGTNTWDMHFTDAMPISYDVELGFGKADLDFTGLAVKDLNLSAGASSVELRFDKPNNSVIEEMNIESGLSKFRAEGLCNANFNNFRFQGGVGSYVLDFAGKLDREVDVDIEVGLGSLTVIIPSAIGAKIEYEKSLINHISLASDFSEGDAHTYTSENYYNSHGKLNMRIEAGLGSVKIKRE